MKVSQHPEISNILNKLAETLDISEAKYEDAEERYKAVGKWLNKEGSSIERYRPEIFPQGSFRLGTVVKPLTNDDEYDIDLVCLLNLTKTETTQKQLKDLVGARIEQNEKYKQMLDEEGRRCWTLNYSDTSKFHLDILPAIPENEIIKQKYLSEGVNQNLISYSIAITDNTNLNYEVISEDWPQSNPIGYCEWFKEQMITSLNEQKKHLADEFSLSIEEIPDYKTKTTLQKSIQILKRHRDIMFVDNSANKPISIIITTLAARAYQNEPDITDAILNIINTMERFIENRNGVLWVSNPVNPNENFADKWVEHPNRRNAFHEWLNKVKADFNQNVISTNINELGNSLKDSFGESTINNLIANMFSISSATVQVTSQNIPYIKIEKPSQPWGILS